MAKELTARQARFVEEYLIDPNATRAYKAVYGCSDKAAEANGARLLGNDRVSRAIAEAQTKRSERVQVTQDMVLENLWNVSQRCQQAEPVIDLMTKKPTGEYRFDSAGANRALELIGKHLGMFTDKQELTVKKPHEEALKELE